MRNEAGTELPELAAVSGVRTLIDVLPLPVLVHQDDTIVFANAEACGILGYPDPSAIVGCSSRHVVHAEDWPAVAERLQRARAGLPNTFTEIRWRGSTGQVVWLEAQWILISYAGNPACLVTGRDITARRDAEQKLLSLLHEKELLLREIHHRVKNNLQLVSSVLFLQADLVSDATARAQLQQSQARVNAIALVHDHLYRSRDPRRLDVRSYLQALVQSLSLTLGGAVRGIEAVADIKDVLLDVDSAIACGLVVCELMTNAFMHAFPGRPDGHIRVTLRRAGDAAVLAVADDGIGMPPGFDPKAARSLGFELVDAFAEQLHARVSLGRTAGTLVELRFPVSR